MENKVLIELNKKSINFEVPDYQVPFFIPLNEGSSVYGIYDESQTLVEGNYKIYRDYRKV